MSPFQSKKMISAAAVALATHTSDFAEGVRLRTFFPRRGVSGLLGGMPGEPGTAPTARDNAGCRRNTQNYDECHKALNKKFLKAEKKNPSLKADFHAPAAGEETKDAIRIRVCKEECHASCQTTALCQERGTSPFSLGVQHLVSMKSNKKQRRQQSKLGNRQSTVVKDDALGYLYFDWYIAQNRGDTDNFKLAALAAEGILKDAPNADYWIEKMTSGDDDLEKIVRNFDKVLEAVVHAHWDKTTGDSTASDDELIKRVNEALTYYPEFGSEITSEFIVPGGDVLGKMDLTKPEQKKLIARVKAELTEKGSPDGKILCQERWSECRVNSSGFGTMTPDERSAAKAQDEACQKKDLNECGVEKAADVEKRPLCEALGLKSYLDNKGIWGFFYMTATLLADKARACENMSCVAELYFNGNRHHWTKLGPVLKCDPEKPNCKESKAEQHNDTLRNSYTFRGIEQMQEKGRDTNKNVNNPKAEQNMTRRKKVELRGGDDWAAKLGDKFVGQCEVGAKPKKMYALKQFVEGPKNKKANLALQSCPNMQTCSQECGNDSEFPTHDTKTKCCKNKCGCADEDVKKSVGWKTAAEVNAYPLFTAGFGTEESYSAGISPVEGVEFTIYPAKYYKTFWEKNVRNEKWRDTFADIADLDAAKAGYKADGTFPGSETTKQQYWIDHMWKGTFANVRNPDAWGSNPAEVFRMCNVPWVGGVSGSSIELIKLVDGYYGVQKDPETGLRAKDGTRHSYKENGDPMGTFHEGSIMAIAASFNAFGFHSISEVFQATYAWGYFHRDFPKAEKGKMLPFDVHSTKGDLLVSAALADQPWDSAAIQTSEEHVKGSDADYYDLLERLSPESSKQFNRETAPKCPVMGGEAAQCRVRGYEKMTPEEKAKMSSASTEEKATMTPEEKAFFLKKKAADDKCRKKSTDACHFKLDASGEHFETDPMTKENVKYMGDEEDACEVDRRYMGSPWYNLGQKEMETAYGAKMKVLGLNDEEQAFCMQKVFALHDCRDRQQLWFYKMTEVLNKILATHTKDSLAPWSEGVGEMLLKSGITDAEVVSLEGLRDVVPEKWPVNAKPTQTPEVEGLTDIKSPEFLANKPAPAASEATTVDGRSQSNYQSTGSRTGTTPSPSPEEGNTSEEGNSPTEGGFLSQETLSD